VLITGERGSGKELAARAIHAWSSRRQQPFVPVLMSGLPDTLAADELFGHERNAFTGAEQRRLGKFEAAAGGTVFLDEVADINLNVQASLLRIVERNELSRLGRDLPVHVEARVTAATNQDLQAAMRAGQFREDLYDRLTVFEVKVPPLRERREDIPLLADYFLRHFCAELHRKGDLVHQQACRSCTVTCGVGCASQDFYEALCAYDWPGNVRELKHTMFRLVATVREEVLEARHLPETFHGPQAVPKADGPPDWNLEEAIRRHIESALRLAGHNKTRTAQLLGIPYTTLQSKLKKLGIRSPG
jgi:two-component system response regulator HydG